jgi:phospholipid-binding lipoprotein MlaA
MRFMLGLLLLISTTLFGQNLNNEFASEFEQKKENTDTFREYNIVMTNINDKFYTYLLNPVAKGYKQVVAKDLRVGVSNMYKNIKFPISFINNLLQLKFKNSFTELERFCINTTLGFAGFADVAKNHFGIESKEEDFGQTLGFYGFNNTPHIVLPLLGPSNFRDILGLSADYFINPLVYIKGRGNLLDSDEESLYILSFGAVNEASFNYKIYENLKKDSLNLYILLKNAYEQKRMKEIEE